MSVASGSDGRTQQDRLVRLLWEKTPRAARGPKPSLSIAAIARSASRIADVDGLDGVSMHRVAANLGVTKMALYRYVGSRAELIAAMIESVVGRPNLGDEQHDWRERLERWARQLRDNWQVHPWLPEATLGHRVMGPNELDWTESALAALATTGLSESEQVDAVAALSGYIRSSQSATSAGTQPWFGGNELDRPLRQQLPHHADRYPTLMSHGDYAADRNFSDQGWLFGLRCFLDGLAKEVAKRSAPNPTDGPKGTPRGGDLRVHGADQPSRMQR